MTAASTTVAGSFDDLLSLEQQFYQSGFDSGFPHGQLHGVFEGRELGRDKSWELWEELGYYDGTAKLWTAILDRAPHHSATTTNHHHSSRGKQALEAIQTLVSAFPASNDSSSLHQQQPESEPAAAGADVDISAQLGALRSKYRTSCALVGMRPRMTVSSGGEGPIASGEGAEASLRSLGSTMY
ncbi:hypothetical protein BMF94_3328 [Rhodotorula taiwanensis]|uniref:Essential protein Yae1 N-terminal domain-containing protein n=1 Tax=Rhodotorula taiwanensis TaxID=741276 RepID=A0A2S5BAK0_9BASI|nr:hypothetical protein BMF94_3328 [Rhodotorula taiwanensis]